MISHGWLTAGLVAIFGIVATGVQVARKTDERRALFSRLAVNQEEQDRHLEEYSRLLLERGTLAAYQNVDRIAEEELGMRFPEDVSHVVRAQRAGHVGRDGAAR